MTDKEKLNWIKRQLYSLQEYVLECQEETVGEAGIDTCIWKVINGYDISNMNDDKIDW